MNSFDSKFKFDLRQIQNCDQITFVNYEHPMVCIFVSYNLELQFGVAKL